MSYNEIIITKAIKEANENLAFKEKLLTDPKIALASLNCGELSIGNRTIIFRDQSHPSFNGNYILQTDSNIIITIPDNIDVSDIELSDAELELVAGGIDPVHVWCDLVAGVKEFFGITDEN